MFDVTDVWGLGFEGRRFEDSGLRMKVWGVGFGG